MSHLVNPVRHTKLPADPEEISRLQGHLAYILHASKCSTSSCIILGPGCNRIKDVLTHLPECEDGVSCQQPYCATTKKLIYHFKFCLSPDCPVCSAVAPGPRIPLSEATPISEPQNDQCSGISDDSSFGLSGVYSMVMSPSSVSKESNMGITKATTSVQPIPTTNVQPMLATSVQPMPTISVQPMSMTSVQPTPVVLSDEHITLRHELIIVFHANKCLQHNSGDLCAIPGCENQKRVLLHMKNCGMGPHCQFPSCYRTAELLYHWRHCMGCSMCAPLREALKLNRPM